ncbi:hypothetical protein ISS05_04455 [Candidatus Woesearchaeota archaeon]|nr:hypothetical protein [Candidatus Woesearchaeota archaeon]MBL7054981.1 hypothetical protein [Candidatus Woesearchaeota archaeon]
MKKDKEIIGDSLGKINILSELYDELKEQQFKTDEEVHYAKLKMSYIKEQIIKLTFEVKRSIGKIEESLF